MLSWKDICGNQQLQDLPFKIELDEHGRVIMAPMRVRHGGFQIEIAQILNSLLHEGRCIAECAIATRKGVKVADVAWCSAERWLEIRDAYDAPIAPEICIEVLSESNTEEEMAEKRRLYFEQGAEEVWLCSLEGAMSFFNETEELAESEQVPGFPQYVVLD